MDRAWKANVEVSPNCPRCGSSNTKFCYYNNYSLTQPRYFCKGCRRYWTKGGSLRNVPVGGGCRKNRRGRLIRVSSADGASKASLGYGTCGNAGSVKGACFDPSTSSSTTLDGSHIDLALVYANYLNHNPEPNGECEMREADGRSSDQSMSSLKLFEPNVELLDGNELIGCEFLSDLFAETHLNNENQIYQEGLGSIEVNHDRIRACDNANADCYSLPPLPDEDAVSWPHLRNEMVSHGFQESEFLPTVFGSEAQDPSLVIGTWRDFDLPLDDPFRK